MLGMGEGKISRGRPRMRWIDEILDRTGLGLREATQAAGDRTNWRRVINEVTRGLQRPDSEFFFSLFSNVGLVLPRTRRTVLID